MGTKEASDKNVEIPEIPTGVAICVIGLLAVVCFQSSVHGGFVFDDMEAVVNNDDIKLSTPLINMFHNDFWGTRITHKASHKSYRPLTVLTYRLNVMAAGGDLSAAHFHAVNLVLYVCVCCLSLFVCKALCGERSCHIAFFAATLFTVHPVHSEAVAPAVGRADLLCALFMFCAFLSYRSALKNRNNLLVNVFYSTLAIVLAGISMFTKEQGITILAICSIYELLVSYKVHPRELLLWNTWKLLEPIWFFTRQTIMCLATVLLLLLRWRVMEGTVPSFQKVDNPASFMDSFHLRVLNYTYIYALNMWLLLCPEWLCFDWSMGCVPLIHSVYDSRTLIVVIFSTVFGLVVFTSLAMPSKGTRHLLMAITFLVFPFLPASNVFLRVGFVVAERNLFVPSLGYCLLVALGLQRLASIRISRWALVPSLGLLIVVFCLRSHVRTSQWETERTLFLSAMSVCPLNAKVHYNLAKTSPNYTIAMKHYKDALRLNPDYDQAMNNLANILKDQGEILEAEYLLRKALQLRPDFAAAWMNLGIVLANKKQLLEAEQCYWSAIKYRKNYSDCYYNLGNLYLERKEHSKAHECWRQATSLDPTHHAAWNNLIIMLDSIGQHEEACSTGREALVMLPNSSAIHFNIANSLGKISNFPEAEKHFKAAIKLNSKYPLYYVNLGVLYHHWKKFRLAKEMYLQALRLDPNLKSAKENLRLLQS